MAASSGKRVEEDRKKGEGQQEPKKIWKSFSNWVLSCPLEAKSQRQGKN